MASTYLTRAASGSVTSQTTYTFSFWIKRNQTGVRDTVFMHESASSHTQKLDLHFDSNDNWLIGHYDGTNEYNVKTNMKFRDCNGWYHIVTRIDTTQSTESDRYRIYVNGNQVDLTESGSGYPAQNSTLNLGQHPLVYGRYQAASPSGYFSGILSHCHYCDGQSYDASYFGSTDATTGEWQINVSPSVTYGTNGHFILKDGNSVTDQSGNSNNFTVTSGTLTNTEDNPSNVFATLNTLIPTVAADGTDDQSQTGTFTNGNNTWTSTNAVWNSRGSGTLFAKTGKFYYEVQWGGGGDPLAFAGISNPDVLYDALGGTMAVTGTYSYYGNGTMYEGSSGTASYGTGWGNTNDILGVAVDLDNSKIYYSVNGTWQNSADPGAGTGGVTITGDTFYTPRCTIHNNTLRFNFGNGYFGTTAVSSAGTNASGLGIFEYDVPTGFTAWCTKGLNE
jgi:hypothetical protein